MPYATTLAELVPDFARSDSDTFICLSDGRKVWLLHHPRRFLVLRDRSRVRYYYELPRGDGTAEEGWKTEPAETVVRVVGRGMGMPWSGIKRWFREEERT